VAAMLSLSPKSIETYRSRLMQKIGVTDVPGLVKFSIHHGLISLE
jgi:DNA-binding NarL/FixJ family response regulator